MPRQQGTYGDGRWGTLSTQGVLGQHCQASPVSWVLGERPGAIRYSLFPSLEHSPNSSPFFTPLAGQPGPNCLPAWLVANLPQVAQGPVSQSA